MLASVLDFLRTEFDEYIQLRIGTSTVKSKLCALVDENGRASVPEDTVAISLVNIEEDRTLRLTTQNMISWANETATVEPDLKINLVILFAAHFRQYDQALKALSMVLLFLQSNPIFRGETCPRLDRRVSRLTLELLTVSYEQLNQIWGFVGGKQLPSVFCRLRTVTISDTSPAQPGHLIRTVESNVRPT